MTCAFESTARVVRPSVPTDKPKSVLNLYSSKNTKIDKKTCRHADRKFQEIRTCLTTRTGTSIDKPISVSKLKKSENLKNPTKNPTMKPDLNAAK